MYESVCMACNTEEDVKGGKQKDKFMKFKVSFSYTARAVDFN